MSQADELLDSLTDNGTSVHTAGSGEEEEHIVIGNDRFIIVPDSLKKIAVQFDHRVETVTFDCPRYWDNADMSKMKVYINYIRSDGLLGMYHASNVVVDEEDNQIMHFDWTITRNVTGIDGVITFLVCTKKTDKDGNEETHWNTELNTEMYVSSGLENDESIKNEHPDIITQLLYRMDAVEAIATPEAMQNYVTKYLSENDPAIKKQIEDDVKKYMLEHESAIPDAMRNYVREYLEEHPALFVIGPNDPGVGCLWFNTGESDTSEDNIVLKLTADSPNDGIYAEVEKDKITDYNFDIL